MTRYSKISIIYNPKSTGDSKTLALKLMDDLQEHLPKVKIECIPTKYAGHARVLAKQIATSEVSPLIVSSSGDGGYNEVVNGVMDSGNLRALTAVLPAGNANDHSHAMQKHPIAEEIIKAKPVHLDLLKITIKTARSKTTVRYAHSYAGLGLTPVIGAELNQNELNSINQIVLVLKSFKSFKPFTIHRLGKDIELDSLVFGNINRMAKILTLAPENRPDDGKFEVITFRKSARRKLIAKIVKASTFRLNTTRRQKIYIFRTVHALPMQLDGEIVEISAGSRVRIESAHKVLRTII